MCSIITLVSGLIEFFAALSHVKTGGVVGTELIYECFKVTIIAISLMNSLILKPLRIMLAGLEVVIIERINLSKNTCVIGEVRVTIII